MKKIHFLLYTFIGCSLLVLSCWNCSKPTPEPPDTPVVYPVAAWITSADRVNLLYGKTLPFSMAQDQRFPVIAVDTSLAFQSMEGFGYTLTGGSAQLISQLAAPARASLLQELFGNGATDLAVSYLRISIGASDLDPEVFSYDDLPDGQTDKDLLHFNLSKDTLHLIPLLQEIVAIRPGVKIMGSPWSPPVWMKNNNSSKGGNLKPEYYASYAQYFVKYIQSMKARGIRIDAVTPQNEPQHGGNNPSLVMSAAQQADFVKNYLGPAFQSAGLDTKIIIWDHNCDGANFPLEVLADAGARNFIDGTAFHLYGGDEGALSTIHDAYPEKNLYFTEQWTGGNSTFSEDFPWHVHHVMIGTVRNWSRIALEWNLANDPNFEPHTPGGCTLCQGALTISGQQVSRNVSYYIIAQMSRFVPPGSVRISSNLSTQLPNAAFKTPDGKKVLVVLNESAQPQSFNIQQGSRWIVTTLNPGNAGTFVWK